MHTRKTLSNSVSMTIFKNRNRQFIYTNYFTISKQETITYANKNELELTGEESEKNRIGMFYLIYTLVFTKNNAQ